MKFPLFFILLSCLLVLYCGTQTRQELHQQGLVGACFGNEDFTNIRESEIIASLDLSWDEETGHGSSWSGVWEGMVIPPASGPVTFYLRGKEMKKFNNIIRTC
jgi:hypothetical protein